MIYFLFYNPIVVVTYKCKTNHHTFNQVGKTFQTILFLICV